jgi:hypothetical protein
VFGMWWDGGKKKCVQNPGGWDLLESGIDSKREGQNFIFCSLILRSYMKS